MEKMQTQERRSSRRIPLAFNGYAVINGVKAALRTHDISPGGALVEIAEFAPRIGEVVQLGVHLDNGFVGDAVVYRATPHNSGGLYGIKFSRFDFQSGLLLAAYISQCEYSRAAVH